MYLPKSTKLKSTPKMTSQTRSRDNPPIILGKGGSYLLSLAFSQPPFPPTHLSLPGWHLDSQLPLSSPTPTSPYTLSKGLLQVRAKVLREVGDPVTYTPHSADSSHSLTWPFSPHLHPNSPGRLQYFLRAGILLICPLSLLLHPAWCLAQNKCSINICWQTDMVREKIPARTF